MPRTIDHNPKTTVYLWHASLPHAYRTLENTMMKALATLLSRREREAEAGAIEEKGPRKGRAAVSEDAFAAGARLESLDGAISRLYDTILLLRAL